MQINIFLWEYTILEMSKVPGGERTGPLGLRPRTRRGAGYYVGFRIPGYAKPGFGGMMR